MPDAAADTPANISTATKCSAALAATIMATRLFRAALDHSFSGGGDQSFLVPSILFAFILGIAWLGLLLVAVKYAARRGIANNVEKSKPLDSDSETQSRPIHRDLKGAGIIALVLAVTAWLALEANI
jgi:hypothetical protein